MVSCISSSCYEFLFCPKSTAISANVKAPTWLVSLSGVIIQEAGTHLLRGFRERGPEAAHAGTRYHPLSDE